MLGVFLITCLICSQLNYKTAKFNTILQFLTYYIFREKGGVENKYAEFLFSLAIGRFSKI